MAQFEIQTQLRHLYTVVTKVHHLYYREITVIIGTYSLGVFGCNFPLHRYRGHAINYMTVRLRSVYDSCSGYLLSHDYTVPVEYGRHVHPTDAALTEYLVFFSTCICQRLLPCHFWQHPRETAPVYISACR